LIKAVDAKESRGGGFLKNGDVKYFWTSYLLKYLGLQE
jgi:hypothetical protein